MLKKTIKYVDYNGNEREEDFYFNFTEAEALELTFSEDGGLEAVVQKIVQEQNLPKIIEYFKKIILAAYGEKSADGKRFIKNDDVREAFSQTEAFSKMFIEFATDPVAAAAFVNGVVPKKIETASEEKQTLS